jgi:hypothetical protein
LQRLESFITNSLMGTGLQPLAITASRSRPSIGHSSHLSGFCGSIVNEVWRVGSFIGSHNRIETGCHLTRIHGFSDKSFEATCEFGTIYYRKFRQHEFRKINQGDRFRIGAVMRNTIGRVVPGSVLCGHGAPCGSPLHRVAGISGLSRVVGREGAIISHVACVSRVTSVYDLISTATPRKSRRDR